MDISQPRPAMVSIRRFVECPPARCHATPWYRLYEGSSVLATATTTGVTLTLPSGPTHAVDAVAVDPAGNESTLDGPALFSVPYLPVPEQSGHLARGPG
jgi:hypothetical protein